MKIYRVKVDPEKVMAVVNSRGGNRGDISEELGHDRTFISHVITQKHMSQADYLLFKALYNVDVKASEGSTEETGNTAGLSEKIDKLIEINTQILEELKGFQYTRKEENEDE